jgi:hypothetical protein
MDCTPPYGDAFAGSEGGRIHVHKSLQYKRIPKAETPGDKPGAPA